MENFKPTRNCSQREHECENSYGYKICVEEKIKHVACAKYSKKNCGDDQLFLRMYEQKGVWSRFVLRLHILQSCLLLVFKYSYQTTQYQSVENMLFMYKSTFTTSFEIKYEQYTFKISNNKIQLCAMCKRKNKP